MPPTHIGQRVEAVRRFLLAEVFTSSEGIGLMIFYRTEEIHPHRKHFQIRKVVQGDPYAENYHIFASVQRR